MKVDLVANLKRQATKILADLHESKEPKLITENVWRLWSLWFIPWQEVIERIHEAIELHLESLKADGIATPPSVSSIEFLEVS